MTADEARKLTKENIHKRNLELIHPFLEFIQKGIEQRTMYYVFPFDRKPTDKETQALKDFGYSLTREGWNHHIDKGNLRIAWGPPYICDY